MKVPMPGKELHKGKPPAVIPKSAISFAKKKKSYEPLAWDEFFDRKEMILDDIPLYIAGDKGPVFFCLHGAGLSSLSFAALAKQMKDQCTLVAFDWRGHGANKQEDPGQMDEQTLINDALRVLHHLGNEMAEFNKRSLLIIGHSMGGAIAAKLVHKIFFDEEEKAFSAKIKGYFIIDVVEGSALDVLPMMEQIVKTRPQEFDSLADVVKYGYTNHISSDLESARVSLPDQVVKNESTGKYTWKVDLLESKEEWTGWFTGLSEAFLQVRLPKQLILASNDRMDTELSIAHMQGKFKLVVIPNVGHAVQEDDPRSLAKELKGFLDTFSVVELFEEVKTITSISGKKIVIHS